MKNVNVYMDIGNEFLFLSFFKIIINDEDSEQIIRKE